MSSAAEIKEAIKSAGTFIEPGVADATGALVVFDEAQDGGLVGHRVIDIILFGPRRHHQQGKTRAVTAARFKAAGDFAGVAAALARCAVKASLSRAEASGQTLTTAQ